MSENKQVSCCFQVIPSRVGLPSLKANKDGREIWLHSPYDPVREARQWASGVNLEDGHVPVVVGLGFGYHVAELTRRYPGRKMLVLEPVPHLYNLAKNEPHLNELLSNCDINLFMGENAAALSNFLSEKTNLYGKEELKIFEYPPLARCFRKEFDQLERSLVDGFNTLLLSFNTTRFFSKEWTDNFLSNLPYIIDSPGVKELFGIFPGSPGVIVSAGPSLSKNIHLLKDVKGKGLIIVVGTALRPVLQSGVIPDLVVSVDGGEPNYRHFKGLDTRGIPLAFYPSVYPRIVNEHAGPLLTMNDVFFGSWLKEVTGQDKGWISTGPSVANVAFDLAVQIGLNPIVFIGQDLAYTGGRTHAAGTVYSAAEPKEGLIEVEGIKGGTVLADRVLNSMRDWLNNKIAELPDDIKVINATEGGAKIEGTVVMTFQEAISRHFCEDLFADKIIRQVCGKALPLSTKKVVLLRNTLKKVQTKMTKVFGLAAKGMGYAAKLKSCYEKKQIKESQVDSLLKKLDRVDERIKKYKEKNWLLNLLCQQALFSLEVSFEPAVDESEKDKGRRLAEKSLFLYLGIKESSNYASDILGRAMDKLDCRKEDSSCARSFAEPIPELPGAEHSDRVSRQVNNDAL